MNYLSTTKIKCRKFNFLATSLIVMIVRIANKVAVNTTPGYASVYIVKWTIGCGLVTEKKGTNVNIVTAVDK